MIFHIFLHRNISSIKFCTVSFNPSLCFSSSCYTFGGGGAVLDKTARFLTFALAAVCQGSEIYIRTGFALGSSFLKIVGFLLIIDNFLTPLRNTSHLDCNMLSDLTAEIFILPLQLFLLVLVRSQLCTKYSLSDLYHQRVLQVLLPPL